jgi:hypothetical protein
MSKIIKIDMCSQCKEYEYVTSFFGCVDYDFCNKKNKVIDNMCMIPDWCELKDFNNYTTCQRIEKMQVVINQCKDTFEKIIPMEREKVDGSVFLTKSGKLAKKTLEAIKEFENGG